MNEHDDIQQDTSSDPVQRHWVSYDPASGNVRQQADGPVAPDIDGCVSVEVSERLAAGAWHFDGADFKPGRAGSGLEAARKARWLGFKDHRQTLDEAPIALRDFFVDADTQSRQDVMGAFITMQASGEDERAWRCADNVMRSLSLADLLAVGSAIAARRQALIETSDRLYQQLQAATSADELAAVEWP